VVEAQPDPYRKLTHKVQSCCREVAKGKPLGDMVAVM
jgi:hypothetical protein